MASMGLTWYGIAPIQELFYYLMYSSRLKTPVPYVYPRVMEFME
jgi:hypothetical protein